MITGNRRALVRVSLMEQWDGWSARICYLDDDTEDRQSGFSCRAAAHGWVEARIERHFRLGVPGRLGGGS